MKAYEIKDMIIDNEYVSEESVTTDFTYDHKDYSITFNKTDLEIINSWVFEGDTSLPANLSDEIIESIRDEVKKRV